MTKLELVTKAIANAFGCEIVEAKIDGLVVEAKSNEGEHFSLLIFQRPIAQADEPYFSLSHEGIAFANGCKCNWVANIYGRNKVCAIVAVDCPDIESFDEWGDVVRTYANPLLYE